MPVRILSAAWRDGHPGRSARKSSNRKRADFMDRCPHERTIFPDNVRNERRRRVKEYISTDWRNYSLDRKRFCRGKFEVKTLFHGRRAQGMYNVAN